MNISEAASFLDRKIPDPKKGLPEEVFLFIAGITPMVNVDLLIKDEKGRTLLAWRDSAYTEKGWHLPGGIIRFKETFAERLKKVAQNEIGTEVKFDPKPLAVNEIILEQKTRGHFISFLFKCFLSGEFIPPNRGLKETDAGYLKWHNTCPKSLLSVHQKLYRKYINLTR